MDKARKAVTLSKARWVINKFAPFKSPGGDGIFPAMLQQGTDALLNLVNELFFGASLDFGNIFLRPGASAEWSSFLGKEK